MQSKSQVSLAEYKEFFFKVDGKDKEPFSKKKKFTIDIFPDEPRNWLLTFRNELTPKITATYYGLDESK